MSRKSNKGGKSKFDIIIPYTICMNPKNLKNN